MPTIVCLGDSTTAGTPGFFSPRERPPQGEGNPESQYAYWIQKKHPAWKIYNRGVRGQRTDQMLRRFDWDVLPLNPDWIIILGGVNDIHQGKDLESIRENLTKLYKKALSQKAQVLACTILPLNLLDQSQKEKIIELNLWIREEACRLGLGYCDTYQQLEDPQRPGYLKGTPDEIHPDVAGYREMGEKIASTLESLL